MLCNSVSGFEHLINFHLSTDFLKIKLEHAGDRKLGFDW